MFAFAGMCSGRWITSLHRPVFFYLGRYRVLSPAERYKQTAAAEFTLEVVLRYWICLSLAGGWFKLGSRSLRLCRSACVSSI